MYDLNISFIRSSTSTNTNAFAVLAHGVKKYDIICIAVKLEESIIILEPTDTVLIYIALFDPPRIPNAFLTSNILE